MQTVTREPTDMEELFARAVADAEHAGPQSMPLWLQGGLLIGSLAVVLCYAALVSVVALYVALVLGPQLVSPFLPAAR
ncbi:MAG: hypothetical protein JWR33_1247 [Naasia sp.]|jgi:hypothetical protein|uniref:hypothetical protein n=1 Tax=Naasia sp. TaxID=2546198 RepID=UPI002620F23B|nr:hypothetical protein [Naasia sp.]MCU1570506.1 hypothetical protein [Naasia sp.]